MSLCLLLSNCGEGEVIQQEPPTDWFFKQRAFPYKDIDTKTYLNSLNQKKQRLNNRTAPAVFDKPWNFIGPTNVGGRITDIEMWPDDMNTILAGSASGGIFKSIDQGVSWEPIFDAAASLAIGDMAISKSNPDVIYVGTGEANSGGGSIAYDGLGIYKSEDRGGTWIHAGLEEVGSVGRIAINPKDEEEVYVAAMGRLFGLNSERGIYKTSDGGNSWEHILSVNDSTGGIDLAIHHENPDTIFAALWERSRRPNDIIYGGRSSGLYRSFDGGENWELLENGLPSWDDEMGRIGIAIAPSNQNKIYAFIANKVGFTEGIYVSENLGNTWTSLPKEGIMDVPFQWWFGKIFVDPIDEDEIFLASFNMHKYTLGDSTWRDVFYAVHVDQHALFVHPLDPEFIVNGNDGGIYISYDGGLSYIKSIELPNNQIYTCEIDPNNTSTVLGGMQDNGIYINKSGELEDWEQILGNDGFRILVEPGNSDIIYYEFQNGNAWRTFDGGITRQSIILSIDTEDRKNWNTPLAIDYNNPTTIYYGSQRIWKSENRGESFVAVSEDLSNGPYEGNRAFGTSTSIEVSRVNSDIIYAGTDDGNVWISSDGTETWAQINPAMNVNRWTTAVLPDPIDEDIAYVCFSGFRYDSYDGSIYKTEDQGATWTDITGDLPDIPINDIQVDFRDNQLLFVATDIGVYFSTDEGNHWEILGQGLPNVPIMDIDFEWDGKLAAATYGRSMYYYLVPETVSVSETQYFNLEIYPNPSSKYFIIKTDKGMVGNIHVDLYSLEGEIILNNIDFDKSISINHLPKGIYFLSVKNNKGFTLTTKKLLKM